MEQKERERWLWKFIKVMRHLRRMGNFNSYLAILSALDSGPMRRLDWSRHMRSELSEHAEVMDSSHSFRNYRQLLAEQPPPCLPYIGLILQDLTFVHVGNPDKLHVPMPSDSPDGVGGATVELVNYGKRWQQFAILDNVRRFKAWPYPLERDERVIRGALHNFQPALDEEETWTRSFELKPKRASSNVNC
jgi:Rap guanine nucleotide exchange factor 1